MMIDKSSKKILNVLINNSKKSYRELAKEAHVSVGTVSNKLKELEKEKIIKKYTTLVDYDKLGYDIHVFIKIRVSHGKEFSVEKKLLNDFHVSAIYDITGDFDVLVIARFRNRKELDAYLKKIQKFEFVNRVQTNLILNTIAEEPIEIE